MRVVGTVIAALAALASVAAAITCVAKSRKQEIKKVEEGFILGKSKLVQAHEKNAGNRVDGLQKDEKGRVKRQQENQTGRVGGLPPR